MTLTIEESLTVCTWLMERGLGLEECACILCDMECGDTFALSLIKVFLKREQYKEKVDERFKDVDWGNPVVL
jgi:hypothetical protein